MTEKIEIPLKCIKASESFSKKDWDAVILANEKISERTSYGLRDEIAAEDGIELSWSNGGRCWTGGYRKIPKGTELRLDANQIFLPMSPMRARRIQACFGVLPLYRFSTEAWMRGELSVAEAQIEWAIRQLERRLWEKHQERGK